MIRAVTKCMTVTNIVSITSLYGELVTQIEKKEISLPSSFFVCSEERSARGKEGGDYQVDVLHECFSN